MLWKFFVPFVLLLFRDLVIKLQIICSYKELCKNKPYILIINRLPFQHVPNWTWSQKSMKQEHNQSLSSSLQSRFTFADDVPSSSSTAHF